MSDVLLQQLADLPEYLANHLRITVIALLLGMAASFPLAVLAVRRPRFRYPVLTAVSVVQTIPGLALLALMVALLAGLQVMLEPAGIDVPVLGFWPTIVALTLYSMLPIVRNAVTGILDVDPAMTEAARGVGMTPRQTLWRVELPLAAPVIIAGIRTATVWTVGIATLATPVGQTCLGNYIFSGLQTRNWTRVLFGVVAASLLAIVLDLLIGVLQRAVERRSRRWILAAVTALAMIVLGGLVAPEAVDGIRRLVRPAANGSTTGAQQRRPVVIGSKGFTEQYILAEVIATRLHEAGIDTRHKESLGSTMAFDALVTGKIDCYVDYTGTIWANYMNRAGSPPRAEALAEVTRWLREKHGIVCLGSLGFENAYAPAMLRKRAAELGVRTLADLAPHAPRLKLGADLEFLSRPEWRYIRDAYGLRFDHQQPFDPTFMYSALTSGKADVISAFSSDGRIVALDLLVLEDPRQAIPPYDAVLLLSPAAAARPEVVEALTPLIRAIDLDTMRRANYQVDRDTDKQTPAAAAAWLRARMKRPEN